MNKSKLILLILFTSCGGFKKNINSNSQEPQLVWDFSNENKYVYSLTTSISSEFNTSKDSPLLKSTIVGNGNIIVHAKPNQLADFTITNLKTNYKWFKEDGSLKDSSSFTISTTIKDIERNGVFGESETDVFFKILMPLPSSNIQNGETYKVPLKFPLEDYPTLFNEGFNTITLTKIKIIQGRTCAILNGLLDISDLKITKDIEGHYSQKITGIATYYFDIKEQCFIGSDISMVENSLNKLESQDPKLPGFYSMLSRYTFKIRLNGIADF